MSHYIQFLNLVQGLSELGKLPTLTPLSRIIFDEIALHEASGKPLTVKLLIGFSHIASPTTLHKHLARLRDAGLVTTKPKGNDKRIKQLVLTPQGRSFINQLSKAILSASSA
jgi:DNA-binding transcriptional ArsR family regulator